MRFWLGLSALAGGFLFAAGSPVWAEAATDCVATEAAFKHATSTKARSKWELQTDLRDYREPYWDVALIRQDPADGDPDDLHAGWVAVGPDAATPAPVEPPSKQMAQAFLERNPTSATACSGVLDYARRLGISVQPSKKTRPRQTAKGLYDRTFAELSEAVVSPDGAEALAYASTVSGPLAGRGFLLLLRRDANGGWLVVGELSIWIS